MLCSENFTQSARHKVKLLTKEFKEELEDEVKWLNRATNKIDSDCNIPVKLFTIIILYNLTLYLLVLPTVFTLNFWTPLLLVLNFEQVYLIASLGVWIVTECQKGKSLVKVGFWEQFDLGLHYIFTSLSKYLVCIWYLNPSPAESIYILPLQTM